MAGYPKTVLWIKNVDRQGILWVLSLFVLYVFALSIRLVGFNAAADLQGISELPFTVESALHFRLQEMVFYSGSLPDIDEKINFPYGLNPKETYSVGSEYVYAFLAKLLPIGKSLTDEIRVIQIAWFSLLIPALAWSLSIFCKSRLIGLLAGGVYAFSLASVIRTMGIEMSRENFSLPFLVAHIGCWLVSINPSESKKKRLTFACLSSVLVCCAMMTWDMIQFYLGIFMLFQLIRAIKYNQNVDTVQNTGMCLMGFALFIAAFLNPYLRAHAFWSALPMVFFYVWSLLQLLIWYTKSSSISNRIQYHVFFAVVSFFILQGVLSSSVSNYLHFGELLSAKIQFLNQKPIDPSLLTFNQRIMWVPALHSANWSLTRMFFPTSLILSLLALFLTFLSYRSKKIEHDEGLMITLFFFSFISYILFVRFHVYLILFISFILVLPFRRKDFISLLPRVLLGFSLVSGIALEAANTLREPWARSNVYYPELIELTSYLSDHVAPAPVLANFGVSASVLAYGRCPVLLHPKFETEDIRKRVEEYTMALYSGSEVEFRDWASAEGAKIFIYSLGAYSSIHPEYQMRYFANHMEPSEDTASFLFESRPQDLKYFRVLFENRAYRVFRIISPDDEARASQLALEAMTLLDRGFLEKAYAFSQEALALFPYEPLALRVADEAASKSRRSSASIIE